MKICWENLEKLEFRNGNFYRLNSKHKILYKDKCLCCGEPFLIDVNKKGLFCTNKCSSQGKFNNFYGKKHSIENKDQWSDKQTMFRHSEDTKLKMSKCRTGGNNSFYGKQHSYRTREIISEKITGMFAGINHWNWIDGRSYYPYCSGWSILTKELKEYDDYLCQSPLCEGKTETMTSHHIDYDKQNCHPSNLITLCNVCNLTANNDRDWWQLYYTEIKRRQCKRK